MREIDGVRYLTTAEAAKRIGVSESRIRQLVISGALPHRRKADPRDRTYIPVDAVRQFERPPAGRPKNDAT